MRKEMVIFLIVFSVFLAIGCAGNNGEEAATPNETATEMPAETPNETATEMPAETPNETTTEMPAETPNETTTEMPAETPNETTTEMPAETPNETTTEMPAETPSETTVETPDETMEESKTVEVTIDNSAFDPDSVTILSGDTVRWTNKDSTTHTVDGSTFSSGHLNKGDTFEFMFTEPGTYDYRCKLHPTEQGVVIVE